MAKTANDLLQGILTTLTSINSKMDKSSGGGAGASAGGTNVNFAGNLMQFDKVKDKTKKSFLNFMKDISNMVKSDKGKSFEYFSDGMLKISNALPELVKSLNDLGRMRSSQVDRSLGVLKSLYNLMDDMGDERSARRVEKATKLFSEIGKSLDRIAKPVKTLSMFMAYLGISFVVFAGGLLLASSLLKMSSPLGVIGVLIGVVTVLVGIFALFTLLDKFLQKGINVIKGIGKGFMFLTLGMLGFVLGLLLISSYLGTGAGFGGIALSMLVMAGVVAVIAGMFWLLGFLDSKGTIRKGTNTIKGIGVGFLLLIGGIVVFTLGLLLVTALLGLSNNPGGIALALGVMALVVVGMVGLFYFMGKAAKQVALGTLVAILVTVGISAIAFSMIMLAKAAKEMATLMTTSKDKPPKKIMGVEVPEGIAALGMIGLVFLGAVGAFALLGIPAVAGLVALGAGVAILVSASLILFAVSVKKLVEASKGIPDDFSTKISTMIGGVLSGLINGISVLSEGATGVRGLINFTKNSAKIFAATAVLMAASVSLSMFAMALQAFANLSSMKPIIGHDEKGRPIFGDPINIVSVSTNISMAISTFISSLIESTDGLTRTKGKEIKRMARVLVGKRGILSAVIQFADALKVYASFGKNNEIGYVEFDENGKQTYKKVSAMTVVENMINAFLYFTNKLFSKSEDEFGDGEEAGISGRQKRRMKRMSKALVGRNGILGAVIQFADVLKVFAEFGQNNELPIMDENGKPTGKTLKIETIASNIVKSLTVFSDTLADKLEKGQVKDASKALDKYSDLIEQLNKLSSSMDGLTKMTNTIQELADGIGQLAVNVDKLNTDKLTQIFDKSAAASSRIVYANNATSQNLSGGGKTGSSGSSSASSREEEIDWDRISQMIGDQVGAKVSSSLKNGHFIFEFDTTKSGGVYYWSPK